MKVEIKINQLMKVEIKASLMKVEIKTPLMKVEIKMELLMKVEIKINMENAGVAPVYFRTKIIH